MWSLTLYATRCTHAVGMSAVRAGLRSQRRGKLIAYPISANGVLTRALEAGRAGPAVVFLHGVGARADRWIRNLDAIAVKGFHTYAVDFPGHGFAEKSSAIPTGVPELAAFVLACLDDFEIERFHLVGTSLGGHVAAHVASAAPSRVETLALVGTLGIVPLSAAAQVAIAESVVTTSIDGIRGKLTRVVHDPALVRDDWITEEWRVNNSPGASAALQRFADYFKARINDDLVTLPLAPHLRDSVTLIWGADDPITPRAMAEQTANRLGAGINWIDRAAHAPYFEQPDAFNRILLEHFDKAQSQIGEN